MKTTILDSIQKKAAVRKLAIMLVGTAIVYASLVSAEPSTSKTGRIEGDPKRSNGAIDVTLYQTSW